MSLAPGKDSPTSEPPRPPHEPLFVQVRNQLRQEILEGTYRPGAAIPAEPQLCQRFGVSRVTLRHSIDDLVNEGLIDKLPGKGTFVRGTQYETSLMSLGGFGHRPDHFKSEPRRRVLRKFTDTLDPVRSLRLEVPAGSPVVGLERLLMDGDEILAMDTTRYLADLVPGFLDQIDETTSTFEVLDHSYGLRICRTTGELRIGYASAREAHNLMCEANEPILNIDKILFAIGPRPVALSELALRPHHVNVHFEVD